MAAVLAVGVAFGGALTAAGVYQPSVIIGQLRWENYHMLQAFLTAAASSAVVVAGARKLHYAEFSPRQYADRGWFAPYDGNVVGGLVLGAGMALAGACPDTVLVQTALNIRSGYYALAGSLVGGLAWSAVLRPHIAKQKAQKAQDKKKKQLAEAEAAPASLPSPTETTPLTASSAAAASPPRLPVSVQELLGVAPSSAAVLVGFEALCAVAVGGSALLFGPGPDARLPPIVGGLLIGLAQAFSVAVRKGTLSVSSVYEDVGDWLVWTASQAAAKAKAKATTDDTATATAAAADSDTAPAATAAATKQPRPGFNTILFALAIVLGTRTVVALFPFLLPDGSSVAAAAAVAATTVVQPATAWLGGFFMALGSRIAGGCTSGHGISGMSLLALPSFITMGASFLGGTAVALLL